MLPIIYYSRGTGTFTIMCYLKETDTLAIIYYTRRSLHEELVRLPACFTQVRGRLARLLLFVTRFFYCYARYCMAHLLLGVVKVGHACLLYYAFLACLQCVAQQAGIHMLANYIRCCVVVTVIGVSFISKTDLLTCLL